MVINNIDDFDYKLIRKTANQKRRRGNQGRRDNSRIYKNLYCAFDIEATNDPEIEQAYMYIWQFQIEDYTVVGRTWDEWIIFLHRIKNELKEDEYLIVYVHNLSYEFAFIRGVYDFQNDEVFAIEPRKVLKCEMFEHFEFRCSYLLTNMSLSAFTKQMNVTAKLSGEDFDYSVQRYPWTKLTDQEMLYCITDVISLVEALKVFFSIEGDTFYTIPLTSTGFVRRDIKSAMRHFNRQDLKNMLPDYSIFTLLREAFRGGNTKSNRYYSNMVIDEKMLSADANSMYPTCQINDLFPMSPWIHEPDADIERVCRKIYKQKRACLIKVGFRNIRLKDPMWGCPYIPKHKCRYLGEHYNDNGRILYADYFEITLTDLDFRIILDEYDFDEAYIFDFYHCRYGRLPKPMRDQILKYYNAKTELKNVEGSELYYMMSKAKLNSIYGMCVQSPVKQNIDYINGEFSTAEDDEIDMLEKSNKRAFLNYAWGVWTTAHARFRLEQVIKLVGHNFVYCDTDSVKYIESDNIDLSAINDRIKRESINNNGVAVDSHGIKHYLGVYEVDGEYKKFSTMGAKKYAYVDLDDSLHITIAGVNKSKGSVEMGCIENFKEGFIFHDAGGTESIYNDAPEITEIIREGQVIEITSNVFIRQSTYTLGITGEYRKILNNPAIWLDLFS